MCLGGSAPSAPPPVQYKAPEPVQMAQEQDPAVVQSRDDERRRRVAGMSKTIFTGSQGVQAPAPVRTTTLLGQ